MQSSSIFFGLMLGVLLAAGAAWIVAGLYRRRMVALMRGGSAIRSEQPVERSLELQIHPVARWGGGVDFPANRRATLRLMLGLALLSLLIGLSQSWLALLFVYKVHPLSLNRVLVLAAVYGWPMALGWGMVLRWSWLRTLGAVALYMAAMALLVMWRSNANQSWSWVGAWLGSQVAIPMTVALLVGASGRIRAAAPYLLPPFILLSAASIMGLEVLSRNAAQPPAWVTAVVGTVGAYGTFALFTLLPWAVLAWPVWLLGKGLARGYRNKRFSDLAYLFAVYWFVILFASALPAIGDVGIVAFVELGAWLWIPAGLGMIGLWLKTPAGPPTLLVLRVFQRDAQVEQLFDRVVERWRLTGNTVLIAGTDLMSRTLDPDDLFTYLNGGLAGRFIASEDEVDQRLGELDLAPDPDGRYRVNECYCFDTTWRAALGALVQQSDVVLMDLRGFRPENRGCRYELGVLVRAPHLRRVVLLHDADTAREAADEDIAGAPAGRFRWLAVRRMNQAMAAKVLRALFGAQA